MAANTLAQVPTAATGSNVTSISKSFASACTNGSLIVAAVTGEKPTTATTHTVSDNANAGNYTQDVIAGNTNSTVGQGRASVNSKANTSTSAVQVTVTFNAATYGKLQIYELTNAGGTPAFDSSGQQTSNTGVAAGLSITTIAANCTVIAPTVHYPSGATADTGYTNRSAETALFNSYHQVEDDIDVGAAGAKTLTLGGYSSSGGFAFVAAAYAPPAGGGGTPVTVVPGVLTLTTSRFTPVVVASDHKVVIPDVAELSITTFSPTVVKGIKVTPGIAELVTNVFAPTVTATANIVVVPEVVALTTTGFAPAVTGGQGLTITPDVLELALSTFSPTVTATQNRLLVPSTKGLILATFTPTITATDNKLVVPGVASLTLSTFSPIVANAPSTWILVNAIDLETGRFIPLLLDTVNFP